MASSLIGSLPGALRTARDASGGSGGTGCCNDFITIDKVLGNE